MKTRTTAIGQVNIIYQGNENWIIKKGGEKNGTIIGRVWINPQREYVAQGICQNDKEEICIGLGVAVDVCAESYAAYHKRAALNSEEQPAILTLDHASYAELFTMGMAVESTKTDFRGTVAEIRYHENHRFVKVEWPTVAIWYNEEQVFSNLLVA